MNYYRTDFTMKTKTTRIGALRQQYAGNRQKVLALLGWSEETYDNQWLDMGRAFLEGHFPASDAHYAERHRQIAADRRYWQWWLAEWKCLEAYFLRVFRNDMENTDREAYLYIMNLLFRDRRVSTSFFEQYLLKN